MMLTSELEYTYNGQGRKHPKQGTLKDIGAKHGDRVQDRNGDEADVVMHDGKLLVLYQGWLDPQPRNGHDGYCIISRASDAPASPVRTVTRTEIVPGVYGIVDLAGVDKDMVQIRLQSTAALKTWFTASDISYAIQTLTQILGAMEDKK